MACILVKPYFYVTNFCYAVEKKKKNPYISTYEWDKGEEKKRKMA